MANDLSTLLQGVIQQAAQAPRETGESARYARRLQNATDVTLILADVSSSMDERAGSRRKWDILQEALASVLPQLPAAGIIAFASTPVEIAGAHQLPAPHGGTALHLALDTAARHRPGKTLVISDGHPDDAAAALAAADRLTGTIDVIYVGPDDDREALAFMRRLARAGGGRVIVRDLRRAGPALADGMRQLLALPERGV